MAFVLVDNEAFKITLQIVEDFISKDYDAFIENEPTDDIKLITWKMEIYFKKLEGKENSIVKYYMIPIYKLLKLRFYGYYQDCETKKIYERFNSTRSYHDTHGKKYLFNILTFDFEKNILTKTITIKIICDEKFNFKLFNRKGRCTKYNYLTQMQYALKQALWSCRVSPGTEEAIHDYYKTLLNDTMVTDKRVDLYEYKANWLKDIIKTHYSEIIKNIESYNEYCKTNGIDIDSEKINERIRYIKEYIKDIYDIALV